MKHSNRYYIYKDSKENGITYEEVDGKRFKNNYGLDLFIADSKKYMRVYDGKTGSFLFPKIFPDFEKFLEATCSLEHFVNYLDWLLEERGLSPRYTEPDNNKERKAKDENRILSRSIYDKKKAYFIRFYNEDGIAFYRLQKDIHDDMFTVYALSNNFMVPLGENYYLDKIIEDVKKEDFSIPNNILTTFEKQLTCKNWFVDVGLAEYLGRIDEALAHNKPVKAAIEADIEKEKRENEAKQAAYVEKKNAEYNNAIREAEEQIKNKQLVRNKTIYWHKSYYDYSERSLMLELFRKHEIGVPLKTQGWIKKSLVNIIFCDGDGSISYRYHKRDSKVFLSYLKQLESALNNDCYDNDCPDNDCSDEVLRLFRKPL